jgi:hypothetical protein
MKNLIEALTIFSKYQTLDYPTSCSHDVLYVVGITPEEVTEEDAQRLDALGFIAGDEGWMSFRYGSA